MNYYLTLVRAKFISVFISVCFSTLLFAQKSVQTQISGSDTTISLSVGGNLDAINTRKYQHESVFRYNYSGVENNISFSLENKGTKDIINPRIDINGRGMVYSMKDLVSRIPLNNLSSIDDTVKTIWNFLWDNYYHWLVSTESQSNQIKPIKTFNVYGSGRCENATQVICSMLKYLGYQDVYPIGLNYYHVVGLFKVNGRSIILDPDLKAFYTKRDNKTLADLESIIWDRDLASRQHHGGFETSEIVSDDDIALGYTDLKRTGYSSYYDWTDTDTMFLRIRPNEQVIFNYDSSVGNFFSYYNSTDDYNVDRAIPANSSLGIVKYYPQLSSSWLNSIYSSENAKTNDTAVYSADSAKIASITIDFTTPYVWTNGKIIISYSKSSQGFLRISAKKDYHDDYTILSETDASLNGNKTDTINLFEFIKPNNYPYNGDPMTNLYCVKIEWLSDRFKGITINSLGFENNFQLNPNALPRLNIGQNTIKIVNENGEPFESLLYSHTYKEINDYSVPSPPGSSIYPENGGVVKSSQFQFVWTLPAGMTSNDISDYNIQVSEFADFRFPVSSTFNKLTSQQHDGYLPTWKIPHLGLLNPGTTYYWRIAVRNNHRVWSNWSEPWNFTIDAAGVPVNPSYVSEGDSITIKWQTNPAGRQPVKFYVVASNERGFSYNDSLIIDSTGNSFYTIKNASRILGYAFYRIVATDENGSRSGASDLITVDDRLLYNVPSTVHDSINLKLVKIEPIDFYGRSGPPDYAAHLVFDSLVLTSLVLPNGLKLENNTITGKFTSNRDTVIDIMGKTFQSDKMISRRISFKVDFSPEIVGLTKLVARSDTNFRSQIITRDLDGDSLVYSSDNLPNWLILDSLSGVLSGIPSVKDAGEPVITIKVRDDKKGEAQSNFKIRVWALSPYFKITSVSDSVFKADQVSSVKTNVSVDSDYNGQIKYQLRKGPQWLSINSKTGEISGTPFIEDYGENYSVLIRATDTNHLFSDYNFAVHVTRANTVPRFLTTPNTVYSCGSLYHYEAKAIDNDTLFGDRVVKYVLLNGPSWLSVDSIGLVSGIADDALGKKYKVVIGAIDDFGDTSLQTYMLREQSSLKEFSLYQNYPNPFNQSTTISFDLSKESSVTIILVNSKGQKIKTLANGIYNSGYHTIDWNASNISSGVYFAVATMSSLDGREKKRSVKKMILVK